MTRIRHLTRMAATHPATAGLTQSHEAHKGLLL